MKRLAVMIFSLIILSACITGCSDDDIEQYVVPNYAYKNVYNDVGTNGKQAFTLYTYSKDVKEEYQKSDKYTEVNSGNKEEITGYFEHFDEWAKFSSFKDKYDFTADMITDGDFYFITDEVVSDSSVGQRKARRIYKMYSICYYDTESNNLYYIFNDITS